MFRHYNESAALPNWKEIVSLETNVQFTISKRILTRGMRLVKSILKLARAMRPLADWSPKSRECAWQDARYNQCVK